MPPVTLRVGSDFSEQSARAAAKEAERYWTRQSAQLKVDAQLSKESARKAVGEARELLLRQSADFTVEAKLAQTSARQVVRDAQRIGRDAGTSVGTSFSSGLNQGINQGFANYTAQFGAAGRLAEATFTGMTGGAKLAAVGVAGIGLAAVAGVTQLYQLGTAWDDVSDKITGRTGLMGAALTDVTDAVKSVGAESGIAIEQIGDIAGQVSQSLHLTGAPLKTMTDQLSGLLQVTGQQVDVRALGKAFRVFDVKDIQDQVNALNQLMVQSQATGVPINELIGTMQSTGKIAQQFGLDFGQTSGLLAVFEQAGLDSEKTTTGLSLALKNLARDGQEPQQALANTVAEIKRLHDAGQETAAINLATSVFGKGYVDFLNAIEGGDLDVQALNASVTNLGNNDAISKQKQATADWQEQWVSLTNTLKDVFAPTAELVFSQLNSYLQGPKDLIDHIVDSMKATPFTGIPGTPGTPVTPDSLLPALGIAPPATPAAPAAPMLPTTRPTAPTTGLGPNIYKDWYGPGTTGTAPMAPRATAPSAAPAASIPAAPAASYGESGGGLIAFAQAQAGLPYARGGVGPAAYDCSGLISDLFAYATGKPYTGNERYFTTESDFNSLGFEPGYQAGAFNIGVNSAAAGYGANAHMAATLPNGVNVESGGSGGGVRYGGGAKGAQDFSQMYHLRGTGGGGSAFGGAGDVQRVYVVNFDSMMTGGGIGSGGSLATSFSGGGGGSGGFDPAREFLSGLSSGGGWGGLAGTVGTNLLDLGGSGGAPSSIGPAPIGLPPGVPNIMAPNFSGAPGAGPLPGPAGPPAVQGRAPTAGKGGGGDIGGPALDMAMDAAATGMDIAMPGTGMAAKVGMQMAKRTIKFGGELAAIGAGGLMETFLPNGSALGDPSKSWLGRGLAGISGARPAQENTAGKTQPPAKPVDPNTKEHGTGGGQAPGPTNGVYIENMNNTHGADGQTVARDIERQNRAYGAGVGH